MSRASVMEINCSYLAKLVVALLALLIYCEYLIYYIVIVQCSWPALDSRRVDENIDVKINEKPVRALLLADTHLLGSRNGHWFDKLRREWQMHRAFQSAMWLHEPDIVFFLGDVFDEGLWCSQNEFSQYVARFRDLFRVPPGTQAHVVAGNHDVGFHYGISPYLSERFDTALSGAGVRLVSVRGNHFVLVNSMAMEGDGCFLCRPAELQMQAIAIFNHVLELDNGDTKPQFANLFECTPSLVINHMNTKLIGNMQVSERLRCARGVGKCSVDGALTQFSRPVLLQHFPLYRESDAECMEPDAAPLDQKNSKFRERWECVSRESSELLLDSLEPRLVVDGHTHHGCHRVHRGDVHEFTLPSFSWRNKDNPSFMMAVFTANNYSASKCAMPRESTVILIYAVAGSLLAIWVALTHRRLCRRRPRPRSRAR